MTDRQPSEVTNLDRYGDPVLPWSRAHDLLASGPKGPLEPAILERVASIYRHIGWPAEVTGDAFTAPHSAPSAGPPPWHLYRFTFHTVVGLSTAEPNGATRWRFGQ
jgi:hypothetical protein